MYTTQQIPASINIRYLLLILVAVLFTWLLHEFGHWFIGELLGNEMRMTFNSSYPVSEQYGKPWHAVVISSAGPVITLLQAIVFYGLLKKTGNYLLFPFLFTAFYMRILPSSLRLIKFIIPARMRI